MIECVHGLREHTAQSLYEKKVGKVIKTIYEVKVEYLYLLYAIYSERENLCFHIFIVNDSNLAQGHSVAQIAYS
jgi:hypothetical protein